MSRLWEMAASSIWFILWEGGFPHWVPLYLQQFHSNVPSAAGP